MCLMKSIRSLTSWQVYQESIAVNRILSKVQKSFWSCTHVNSCQKYTLYINLHILLNILSKTTINIQESRKFIKSLKRSQELIKKTKIHCVLSSQELLSTKIYYTSIYIFYLLFISRQIQKSKNDVNPTSTSGDTYKTIFIILVKLFSIGDSFKFKATQETRLT